MQVSVEISLYPLTNDFEPIILDFIEKLKDNSLEVQTNGMSTQIFGDIDVILQKISEAMKEIYAKNRAILVMKMGKGTLKLA
ncbi:YkoF family thiamine/hydroxymethylpyrimidine-binding protein [Raineya orbicola]|uniref:Thiamine-binding protein domain-containing protein n=1 Tax=Raineya orbicola TaxID=2016530 RepID=A0A2N3IE28_9BACT|nr:YkoF family thiamine/hydroxymethylpyrimidine-binding protein [Raineya orbicola]PKQ68567.1 hypothetical protein Rain11_1634 [Raineya orbicola]